MGFWRNLFTSPVDSRVVVARHLRVADDALGDVLSRFRLQTPSGEHADDDVVAAYNALKEAKGIVSKLLTLVEELHRTYDGA